jgi:hypothetical protein
MYSKISENKTNKKNTWVGKEPTRNFNSTSGTEIIIKAKSVKIHRNKGKLK